MKISEFQEKSDYFGGNMENQNFKGTNEYVASEELMASVNIAMALKKPLLIKGEPNCLIWIVCGERWWKQ